MKNKQIKNVLEDFIEDILETSNQAICPVNGYKGIIDEEEIEEQRNKDYDEAFNKTIKRIENLYETL